MSTGGIFPRMPNIPKSSSSPSLSEALKPAKKPLTRSASESDLSKADLPKEESLTARVRQVATNAIKLGASARGKRVEIELSKQDQAALQKQGEDFEDALGVYLQHKHGGSIPAIDAWDYNMNDSILRYKVSGDNTIHYLQINELKKDPVSKPLIEAMEKSIKETETAMHRAAKELDFMEAARLRMVT